MELLTSLLPSIIGGASKIFGGLLGQSAGAKDAQAAQNLAFQQSQMAQQNAIPNLVAGAKAAGINPLAALGVSSPGFSAVVNPNSGEAGKAIGEAGQDISRAALASFDKSKVLEEELLKAKIANVNADTVKLQATASGIARSVAPTGTMKGIPLPPEDPRGPVINLMQRARDPRTGEIVWIPSEKAASPLQTLAASPTNIALGARALSEGLIGFDTDGGGVVPSASARRSLNPTSSDWYYTPF